MIEKLPKPFFVLAPMYDVTDTVFRQVIADCAPPDLFFTEFVNVDGLQSPGRENLLSYLQFSAKEKPIIAQIWGKTPENYYKTAKQIVDGTLIDEIEWRRARRSGLSEVQGNKEKQVSRTNGTASESRTQLTQQFAKSSGRVASSTSEQATAARVSGLGFAGVDINMGCPDKAIMKNGCCAALINNRELAGEIIQAVREAVGDDFPVSVKTRLGQNEVDLSWIEFLLGQKLNMLTIHGRTAKQMSKVPANWELIGEVRELRDKLSPTTLIIGNGDVMTRAEGQQLADTYKLDGIMIGRGVFHDPFAFANPLAGGSPWENYTKEQRIDLYKKHVELFIKTYSVPDLQTTHHTGSASGSAGRQAGMVRGLYTLNKFCKIYINGFDGAKELREKFMSAKSTDELLQLLG